MAATALHQIVQSIVSPTHYTDSHLLEMFRASRDESAFTEIVRRHGPMVMGVCRRVLCNHADSDDAFQAVFVVLARRADVIHPPEMLVNWLYGVAVRTARKAKTARDRRQYHEANQCLPDIAATCRDSDLSEILDRELSRLPDHYRLPMILCDLESKTRREAAAQLGWPEGTVAGRLARGRATLARRLIRLGVAPSAAVGTFGASSSPVPGMTVAATVRSILGGMVSPTVVALTKGAIPMFTTAKWKAVALLTMVILMTGIGAETGGFGTSGSELLAADCWRCRPQQRAVCPPGVPDSIAIEPAQAPDPKVIAEIQAARERYEFSRTVYGDLIDKKNVEGKTFHRAVTGLEQNDTAAIHKLDSDVYEKSKYLLGSLLYQHHDYEKAINAFREALRQYEKSTSASKAKFQLGRSYWNLAAKDSPRLHDSNLTEEARNEIMIQYRRNLKSAKSEFDDLVDILSAGERENRLLEGDQVLLRQSLFARVDCHFFLEEYQVAAEQYEELRYRYKGKLEELIALSQLWHCHRYLKEIEIAKGVASQLSKCLDKMPVSEFPGVTPLQTRDFWKKWLDQVKEADGNSQ